MGQAHAPLIETARLTLRGFQCADLDALEAIYADPDVMRYLRSGVRASEETAAVLDAYIAGWGQLGHGVWAVTDKRTSALLGMCGFVERAELGYIFARSAWGRGVATEVASACIQYGFERLGFDEIGAGALLANAGSLRVLEKLGMRRTANPYFDTNGGAYYHLTRAEYTPSH